MSWVLSIPRSLELRRSCANLRGSRPPSFAAAWQSPRALHTCRHRDHHRQNSRSTAQRPTKWWDFGLAPTVRSSPTGRLTPKYFKQGSTSAMLWKKAEGCRDLPWWRFIMVSLYNHQLLVWPTLVQKTLPQLWVEWCPRCRSRGHSWHSTKNLSNGLSQFCQADAFHCF